tara:strand:- start:392 stop:769 length:378 start_codon:yes stop_codon:yes gene_type:complete
MLYQISRKFDGSSKKETIYEFTMDPSEDTREQTTDETPELTKELTYEEEQLQMFLIQEAKRKQIADQRELREQQDREYNESLKQEKEHEIIQAEPTTATTTETATEQFDEPSLEEMRRVRLRRFS